MSHTSAIELPQGRPSEQPGTPGPRSRLRSPWMAPLVALALTLAGASGLELLHRQEVCRFLGYLDVAPSSPEGRAFSTAIAWSMLGDFRKAAELFEDMAMRWPHSDVAVAAWRYASVDYKCLNDGADEALRCMEQAARAVSPESDRFARCYGDLASQYAKRGEPEKAIAVLRRGFDRTSVTTQRAWILADLMARIRINRAPAQALRTYQSLTRGEPRLREHEYVARALARTYLEMGDIEQARPFLERVASESSSESWRQWARRKLEEMETPSRGN